MAAPGFVSDIGAVNQDGCTCRRSSKSNSKQTKTKQKDFSCINIDRTTTGSLEMEIFAQFQANLHRLVHLKYPRLSVPTYFGDIPGNLGIKHPLLSPAEE